MLRSILIGLDGSSSSSTAVELGLCWARRFDALLVGLGVVDEPTICRPEPVPIGGGSFKKHRDAHRLADARRQVDGFLAQFAQRCAGAGVACQVLQDVGRPYEQILLEAERFDLVLLGQHPRFHFETQDRDTDTLHKVLKGGARPVVVVPEKLPAGRAILLACDGSFPAARALQAVQAAGLIEGQEVWVVSVGADRTATERQVGRAVEYLRLHSIEAMPCPVVTSASPARVLLDQARQRAAGLIVMGAYGRSRLREFLRGSLTRTLLRESPVPLFLCH
jgi:nucleotide-binding universal stress UspA family protein